MMVLMRQQVKTVTFFTDNTTHQLSKNQCSTSKNKMLKLSTWINALPGLTHHFSNFAAKMMPTKPNTLEHRRHGYRAMRSVAGAPIRPNPKPSLHSPHPQKPLHIWIRNSIKRLLAKYHIFTKLSQISHNHKNRDFNSIIEKRKTYCFYPINLLLGACKESTFFFFFIFCSYKPLSKNE